MGVGLVTWRVRIGTYNSKSANLNMTKNFPSFFNPNILNSLLNFLNKKLSKVRSFLLTIVFSILLRMCADIEKNPGPRNSRNTLKLMHWNLNSFKTSNFYRKTLIETFNLAMNYDVIAISESALHSYSSIRNKCQYAKPTRKIPTPRIQGYKPSLIF